MNLPDPVIERMQRNLNGYYTVHWSPLLTADKYKINSSVPAMSGIYELYYRDPYGKLILHDVDLVWYGGLRSRLRRITDPTLEEDLTKREFIAGKKFYFRYSLSKSYKDMQDVIFFLSSSHGLTALSDSGRFKKVYLRETSPNKLTTI